MNEDAHTPNQPLDFDPAALPEDVRALPEPARQAAIDAIQRMLESGAPRDEAIEKGRAMASDWISQRAPGDQSEVKVDDAAVPDREALDDAAEMRITTKFRVANARQG